MTLLKYVAKFTELASFGDDYVANNMAKVRKFEDGLKLSIQRKVVGFLLQDMDSMVRTAVAIKREIDDARSTRDSGASGKRKEDRSSSGSGKKQKASSSRGFKRKGHDHQGQGQIRASSQLRHMTCYFCHQPGHIRRDFP